MCFGGFDRFAFLCAVSVGPGLEVCLQVEGDVHLLVKNGSTESLGSETLGIQSGFLWAGEHATLSWRRQEEASSCLGCTVPGVAEKTLEPVSLGKCPAPRADLSLFQSRQRRVRIRAGEHAFHLFILCSSGKGRGVRGRI